MPLTELDPNVSISGRNSRSSTSNLSSSVKDARRPPSAARNDLYSTAPSVFSMLKTTTETGDLGSLSIPQNRLPKLPRGPSRRPSAPSRTSSQYSRTASVRSKGSNNGFIEQPRLPVPGAWPSHQQRYARNLASEQTRSDVHPTVGYEERQRLSRSVSDQLNPDQRSYSLTHSHHPIHRLNEQRSIPTLRSLSPTRGPRSPYHNPSRLRHANHRPSSPAFSDTHGAPYNQGYGVRQHQSQRVSTISPLPPHVESNYGYRHGVNRVPLLRYHQPSEDRQHFFEAPGNSHTSLPQNTVETHRSDGFSGLDQSNMPYNQPVQVLRPASPLLKGAYTRFGARSPVAQAASLPPQPLAYGGFVQRVKNILEEKASAEDISRARCFSNPSKQSDMSYAPLTSPQPPGVARITRTFVKAALDIPSEHQMNSSPDHKAPTMYHIQSETSSGESSSMHANGSIDLPRIISTPGTANMPGSPGSEVVTAASSPRIVSPAVKFSLRLAVQEGTAPTVSEASQSLTDLIEPPADPVLLHEDLTSAKTFERPFSFPQVFESKVDATMPYRQSLPAPAELEERRKLPDFSFAERPELKSIRKSQIVSVDIVDGAASYPNADVAGTELGQNEKTPFEQDQLPQAVNSSVLLDYSHMRPRAASMSEVPRSTTALIGVNTGTNTHLSLEPPRNLARPDEFSLDQHGSQISSTGPELSHRRFSGRNSDFRGSTVYGEAKVASTHNSFDANDARILGLKNLNFPLPDLTEDSQEDASTTNLRMLGAKHPMLRSGGFRNAQDSRYRQRSSAVPEPPSSYFSRKLADTKGIPSLNFSSTDLTATLNRALGLRSSRSLEDIRHSRTKAFRNSGPRSTGGTRTVSQGDASSLSRERYKSFFSDEGSNESENEEPADLTEKSIPREILSEIERISIPSVNGLTVRLSELIPTIKRCSSEPDITKSDAALELTIEEIRDLGSPARLASMDRKRASLVSIMRADRAAVEEEDHHEIPVKDERSPSQLGTLQLMKALPPLPTDVMSPRPSMASGSARSPPISEALPLVNSGPTELETGIPVPPTIETSPKALRALLLPSPKKFKLKKSSNRTLASTPDARPWNRQANYPWSDELPPMDIRMPVTSREAGSPIPRQTSRLEHSRSTAELSLYDDIRIARSMSPGTKAHAGLIPQAIDYQEPSKQTLVKKGPIGSLIRRMGMGPRVDKAGFPIDPHFFHREERATEPGDRYPTTGLTPPSGLNIEENRSFFSDDSSDNEQPNVGNVRKRLTRSKQKRSASRIINPGEAGGDTSRVGSAFGHDESVFGGSHVDTTNPDAILMMYDNPPMGMSKAEFHTKRMVEKFRLFWFRSGRFLRQLNHKKKQAPSWYEASELYSGT